MFQWLTRAINRKPTSGDVETHPLVEMKNLQIEINLLPAEYAPQRLYSLRNISLFVLTFLTLSFLVIDALQMIHREKEFSQRNQDMLRTLNNFRQLKNNIEVLREQTALLRKRYDLLAGYIDNRMTWSDKLSQIHTKIPAEVWLSGLSLERKVIRQTVLPKEPRDKTKKPTVEEEPQVAQEQIILRIVGEAKSLANISELIRQLETTHFLDNIRLSSIHQTEQVDHLLMSFEIIAQVSAEGNAQL